MNAICWLSIAVMTSCFPTLPQEKEVALRKVVAESELTLSTRIDGMGFPRKHLDMPDGFLAIYRENPRATLKVLLDVIQDGTPNEAHIAYVYSIVRDGNTEGHQGLAFYNIKEIDLPGKQGITDRQRWAKSVERIIEKMAQP